jgi:hypothetical protein
MPKITHNKSHSLLPSSILKFYKGGFPWFQFTITHPRTALTYLIPSHTPSLPSNKISSHSYLRYLVDCKNLACTTNFQQQCVFGCGSKRLVAIPSMETNTTTGDRVPAEFIDVTIIQYGGPRNIAEVDFMMILQSSRSA